MTTGGDGLADGGVPTPKLRVVLADDHTMLREGLRRSLEAAGLDVVAEAGDGDAAAKLAAELLPDVVLMDVSMPVLDGIEATRFMGTTVPQVPVVILTMHADDDVIRRAAAAGAAAYLVKDCTTDEVVDAVRRAAAGEITIRPPAERAPLASSTVGGPGPGTGSGGDTAITRREAEVLQLIARGAATTEVADQLFISVKTVKNHLASVYQKLESRDRTQAIVRAVRLGIITLDDPAG